MKQRPNQQKLVDEWNNEHEIGMPVRFWTGFREGEGELGKTTSSAYLLSGHTAVVMIDNASGCIALSHVEAHHIECRACSMAGGADRAVMHAPPECPMEAAQ